MNTQLFLCLLVVFALKSLPVTSKQEPRLRLILRALPVENRKNHFDDSVIARDSVSYLFKPEFFFFHLDTEFRLDINLGDFVIFEIY